ncbi:lipoprotein [Burkholderia pseudomallei]|nr:lipoprotein [Burkholderia pseudomallei]CAJ6133525.1 lipoprotein [Burkholderia pseudomallei]VCQ60607.1 lipoprotein [Burkholderia pseudomallei]VCQ63857.1 lipoprotein [Burkholderia pseudomallei]VCQ65611.1 lipoprotein [Burkholderia pseudomallei]
MMNRSQQTFAGFAAACAFAAGSAAQAWAAPADAIVYPAGNGSDQADALQAALEASGSCLRRGSMSSGVRCS